jgi:Zn-dependent protease with chaperone function
MPSPIISFFCLLAIAIGCGIFTCLAMHLNLVAWRKRASEHWTLRARILWTARTGRTWIVICALLLGVALAFRFQAIQSIYLTFFCLIAGVALGLYPSTREIEPRFTFSVWLRHALWVLLFQFGLIAIGLWLAITMPDEMDQSAWLRTALGLLGAIFLISGIYFPAIARLTPRNANLGPMHERLHKIADRASQQSGVTPRHMWLADSPIANAVAYPIINAVTFTSRTMELLDDEECLAVMYHEYGHLREPWSVRLVRMLPTLAFFGFVFVRPMTHAFGSKGILLLCIALILIQHITSQIMRRMEHHADDLANQLAPDPTVYARALEKLHEASQIPAVMAGNKMIHPNLYDRMTQAGLTPSYDPPSPPKRMSVVTVLVIGLTIVSIILLLSK